MTTTKLNTNDWHILGAGSIGTLWACHLSFNKVPVRLLFRDQQRSELFPGVVKISGQTPDATIALTAQAADCNDPINRLLVTTKSYDTASAIRSIKHRLTHQSLIVLLQNGMGQHQQISELFADIAIYGATTTEGAFKQSASQLIHAGRGESWIGPINGNARQRGHDDLVELLNLELKTNYDANIEQRLWQKLAINAAINGLTAKHNCQNGELASNPDYNDEMRLLCNEIEAVAKALRQPLFDRPLIEQAEQVATATAGNYSSMLQDVRNQRRTEIDFINEYIVQQAKPLGINTSENQSLIKTILHLNR